MIRRLQIVVFGGVLTLLTAAHPMVGYAEDLTGKVIGILPIENSGEVNTFVNQSVRGFEGLKVVSLTRVDEILGAGTKDALIGCKTDELCRAKLLASLKLDYYLAGTLAKTARGSNLRLRLVQMSDGSQKPSKTTVNVNVADEERQSLKLAVIDAVSSLFGESGLLGFGTIEIRTSPQSASIILDDQNLGISPVPPLRVAAGSHRLKIEKKGFRPWYGSVDVMLGESAVFNAELEKNRSAVPLYLGAGALSAAVTGLIFGLHAAQITNGWETACSSGFCAEGYSSQRYSDESRLVDIERNVANSLFAVGVGLGISAIVTYILDEGVDTTSKEITP